MKRRQPVQITGLFLLLIILAIPFSCGDLIPSGQMDIADGPSVTGKDLALIQRTETQEIPGEEQVTSSSCPECQSGSESYGVMIVDESMMQELEEMNANDMAHPLPMATETAAKLRISSAGDKDLSQYVPYFGNNRNQGSCGNCWAFAGTGLTEVSMAVQTGVTDRLSVQYLNSLYNGGTGSSWACCGGNLGYYTGFYSGTGGKKLVPWSNTGASYVDGYKSCGSYPTAQPAAQIATNPNYPITSMSYGRIDTWTSDELAIANIKNALDNNKAVYVAFYWYDSTSNPERFQMFWSYDAEDAKFDPVAGAGTSGGLVGHAVMIIGYHDDGNGDGYWNILNSWGTRANRPLGTYHQDMYINYHAIVPGTSYPVTWYYTLDVTFDSSALLQPVISEINPQYGWNDGPVSVSISGEKFAAGADVRLTRTGYTPIIGTHVQVPSDSSITCTFDLSGQSSGSWNIVVTNPNGLSDTFENEFLIGSLVSDFTYWPATGVAPLKIYCTDTSTGFPAPSTWNWDFTNDGIPDATGQYACWTYQGPGTYYINLTVGNGLETETILTAIERE